MEAPALSGSFCKLLHIWDRYCKLNPSGVHPPNSNGLHPSLSIPFFSASIEFLSKSHTSTLSAFMESNSKSKKCGLFSISYNTRNHTDNSQYITETYRKQRNPYTNTDTENRETHTRTQIQLQKDTNTTQAALPFNKTDGLCK